MLAASYNTCKRLRLCERPTVLTLGDLPFETLLEHLAARQATGTLEVHTGHLAKKLHILDGQLAGIVTSNPRERLGHFAVGWGLITEQQLSDALDLHERLGTPVGQVLERMGFIDHHALDEILTAQAEEALLELFLLPIAAKWFAARILPVERPLTLRIPLPRLVAEGLRRRERQAELADILGRLPVVPARGDREPPAWLTAQELLILAEIDGEKDLEGIALACRLPLFHVAEFVARGVEGGFLRAASRPQAEIAQHPREILRRAEAALADGALRECWQGLQGLRSFVDEPVLRRASENLERGLAEAIAQRRIAGHLVPRVLVPHGGVAPLNPAEAFVLSRINDRSTLREIARLSPVDELQFGVIVDTLVELRLVELRHPKGGPALP